MGLLEEKERFRKMNDKHMFKAAREISLESDYCDGRVKVGCVIVYKGTVLAKACNSDKTHPAQDKYNAYRFDKRPHLYTPSKGHAEVLAVSRIKYLDIDFSKVHVFVYRELKTGELGLCRPCNACLAAIRELGIKHIHYTTYDGFCHEVLKYE